MKKYTLKTLKTLIDLKVAEDVTYLSCEEMYDLIRGGKIRKIGYSCGTYGVNGALLKNEENGKLYALVSRSMALLSLF